MLFAQHVLRTSENLFILVMTKYLWFHALLFHRSCRQGQEREMQRTINLARGQQLACASGRPSSCTNQSQKLLDELQRLLACGRQQLEALNGPVSRRRDGAEP